MAEIAAFYGREQVANLTTLSPSTIWRLVKSGEFPAPVSLSRGRVAWPAGVVNAWIAEKLKSAADGKAG